MPRFSIFIPACRSDRFLGMALGSLEAQTFTDWEAVIVDDASGSVETSRIIHEAVERDRRFRAVVLSENSGPSAARNRGLACSSGDYVAFLDSDDVFLPWTLRTLADLIERENEPGFIAGTAMALGGTDTHVQADQAALSYRRYPTHLDYRFVCSDWRFDPSGAAIRRDLVEKVGGFWEDRELYCEDIDLWLCLETFEGFIRIQSPITYGYRIHGGGIHHCEREMFQGLERIISTEREDKYPGGAEYRRRGLSVVASHTRHHALEFAANPSDLARRLYRGAFLWNLSLMRGFPSRIPNVGPHPRTGDAWLVPDGQSLSLSPF